VRFRDLAFGKKRAAQILVKELRNVKTDNDVEESGHSRFKSMAKAAEKCFQSTIEAAADAACAVDPRLPVRAAGRR
jgi:hypothetical protein